MTPGKRSCDISPDTVSRDQENGGGIAVKEKPLDEKRVCITCCHWTPQYYIFKGVCFVADDDEPRPVTRVLDKCKKWEKKARKTNGEKP